jgi:drug/metabolite transporter (DMT)-like permease
MKDHNVKNRTTDQQQNPNEKAHLAIYGLLFLVPLFWGGSFGAAKHVITEIPPLTTAAIRFGSAGLILLVWVMLKHQWNWKMIRERWMGLLMMSITGIFAYNALFFFGLKYTSAINGSLIMATSPVLITVGAVVFLKESFSRKLFIGMALSLSGVFVVITKASPHVLLALSFNIGDLLFIAAVTSWAVYGLLGRSVMQGISPLLTTTVTTLFGSVLLLISSLVENGWQHVPYASGQTWLEMAYMTVLATVVAFALWNLGVHRVGAGKASAYMNLVPINAAWISALFYDADITWVQLAGMVMVISGVYLTTIGKNPKFLSGKRSIARI